MKTEEISYDDEENSLKKRGERLDVDSIKTEEISYDDEESSRKKGGKRLDFYSRKTEKMSHDKSAAGDIKLTQTLQNQFDFDNLGGSLPLTNGLSKSALAFVDAIKKNRSCQKAIRSTMKQVQEKIDELKTLKDHVMILQDFQIGCKKRTSRALVLKDARVQLISSSKSNDKTPVMRFGPPENPHVAVYEEVLTKFPSRVTREKWSKKEIESLKKGVKQHIQEMLLKSFYILNDTDKSAIEGSTLEMIADSLRNCDITPQNMRSFQPKINWEQLSSTYVPKRSGMECQMRWVNCEDPLINWNPWTNIEDKKLLHIVQQKGPNNWLDISVSLGTNRTPFQCVARYQRSLNASIIRREWNKEEDIKLHAAVEEYGESNWQAVAAVMEGRTGTQCGDRWLKSLHPARKRVGKWSSEEDKRLKVAVTIFGPKNWSKIAEFVPGRMQVQCRERWANSLDPSLNYGSWTSKEDLLLKMATQEHGYCWSKVALSVPHRTDNQCMRRWTALFPEQVPMLQAANKTKRTAMISNFVERVSERPAIGPNDFLQLPPSEHPPRLKKTYSVNISEEFSGLTNGCEGEDGQEAGTSVNHVRSSQPWKRKVITDDDDRDDFMATQDSAGRNTKKKLKLNKRKDLLIPKCENLDNLESSDSISAIAPKQCKFRRAKIKDEPCSPDNHEAGEDDEMPLATFLERSCGVKKLSQSAEISASAVVDSTAQVNENASAAGVSRSKKPKRSRAMEEPSSDQVQVEESEDDLHNYRFCKKLKDTIAKDEEDADDLTLSQFCKRSKKRKGHSTVTS